MYTNFIYIIYWMAFLSLEDSSSTIPKEVFSWGITKIDITTIPAPKENPMTVKKIQLGRRLFYDPILSGSNTMNCASCHDPRYGFSDPLPLTKGDHGKSSVRKTPSLLNLAWNSSVYWDGRANTLEEQVFAMKSLNWDINTFIAELQKNGYDSEFKNVFGMNDSALSIVNVAKAIASYERTLISYDSPFDRFVSGDTSALSASQKRGLILFAGKANCSKCHNGPNFSDGGFHDIGVSGDDIGRFKVVPVASMRHAFKTPGLRNIESRSPYMHDGSAKTLKDVVLFYNSGGAAKNRSISPDIVPLKLDNSEMDDLVDFLVSLTGKINY